MFNPQEMSALVVIGDEVLSGRTLDANTNFLARELGVLGIPLGEVRVVADEQSEIVAAVNALRARFKYVFTTGGIGPTHDDITAESIAVAFGVALKQHPLAYQALENYYGKDNLNDARLRMAQVPDGAELVENKLTAAPGFMVQNVITLAGVPKIMQLMFDAVRPRLQGGTPIISAGISTNLREGVISEGLRKIQKNHMSVAIGSYPLFEEHFKRLNLIVRGRDETEIAAALAEVKILVQDLGGEIGELVTRAS